MSGSVGLPLALGRARPSPYDVAFWLGHIGSDLRDVHGVVWIALADAVGTQAVAGYFFGLLTLRTGNVLAAGAAHTLLDGGAVFV